MSCFLHFTGATLIVTKLISFTYSRPNNCPLSLIPKWNPTNTIYCHSNNIHQQSCWHWVRHGVSIGLACEYSQHLILDIILPNEGKVMLLYRYHIGYCHIPLEAQSLLLRHPSSDPWTWYLLEHTFTLRSLSTSSEAPYQNLCHFNCSHSCLEVTLCLNCSVHTKALSSIFSSGWPVSKEFPHGCEVSFCWHNLELKKLIFTTGGNTLTVSEMVATFMLVKTTFLRKRVSA